MLGGESVGVDDEGTIVGMGGVAYHPRPTVQSYSRQDQAHNAPHSSFQSSSTFSASSSTASSTALLADAHYAKSLRMLSSNFDRIPNGGNALPHQVYGGGYGQEIGGKNGRGDKFVKMDVNGRRKHRRRRRRGSSFGRRNRGFVDTCSLLSQVYETLTVVEH
mmetsp:Transcript_34840/g.73501  ORF Transcript_34840/g.73501 Transcript_34840/m.73501 type:complete len:162 (+) Transcript_34840:544-1029(+)